MSFRSVLSNIFIGLGKGLAATGKGLGVAAKFVHDHPETVKAAEGIALAAGAPADKVAAVDKYAGLAGQVAGVVEAAKTPVPPAQ